MKNWKIGLLVLALMVVPMRVIPFLAPTKPPKTTTNRQTQGEIDQKNSTPSKPAPPPKSTADVTPRENPPPNTGGSWWEKLSTSAKEDAERLKSVFSGVGAPAQPSDLCDGEIRTYRLTGTPQLMTKGKVCNFVIDVTSDDPVVLMDRKGHEYILRKGDDGQVPIKPIRWRALGSNASADAKFFK